MTSQQQPDRVHASPDQGRLVVMTINGSPVYAEAPDTRPVSEQGLLEMAFRATQNEDVALAWMDRPNLDLDGRTPRELARAGQGHLPATVLRGFLAL